MEREQPEALDAIQRRLLRLVTEPEGVLAALQAEGDADGAGLAAVIRQDRGLAAADRLEVYANAYFARLHDCLREDLGTLARALGEEAFHDLVKTYLMMHPPTRPSLRHAGAHLAEHLATLPFAAIFARRCPYAADLARLEWALTEAFLAEDAPALAREDLAALPPDAWTDLRFELAPSVAILDCAWPVHRVRERFEQEPDDTSWDEAPVIEAHPTRICVWRVDERVRYREISSSEADALAAAGRGESFGALCEHLAEAFGEEEAAPRAAAWLASWLADGLLARML